MKRLIVTFFLFSLVFFGGINMFDFSANIPIAQAEGDVIVPGENPPTEGQPGQKIRLTNPLGDTDDLPTLVQKILEIALKIGVPLIALAIIYTGYLFIAAQGNPEKLQKAKQSLVWVVVGSGILLGAYVIAEALVGTINAIRG